MRMRGLSVVLASLMLLIGCAAKEELSSPPRRSIESRKETYVTGEYVVTARTTVDASAIRQLYSDYGVELVQNLGSSRFLVRLARDPGMERVQRLSVESGQINAVQRNIIYRKQ